ncbi:MAG: glutamine amidotransferase [Burkholderiaceae bacterium]|jgi:GMP synthase (glutamine-hydrolysing)|uniref:Glutamine amidotransferase n=1 Tax=Cupriavidus metallidurans TaxID=119219 RepID=A0A482ILG6_9BURK|nr:MULTISPECIES: glutamine amidotransferase [Cupriavidus]KWR78412.1 glutamine amidotransferase [Cupriavidus sp. SHE]PCH54717.1 MAG: glutamine amidotransferase [Burkholderiaceae bacterium]QBP09578.1 glutamine amidotransferase [Cupriavidus metallidurans]QWC89927.1 glutamine amidotransferase [Cupriavidus metallidurans]
MSDTHASRGPRRTDVIQHVGFEHAGVIADAARARGHEIRMYQAGVDDLALVQDDPADLLVVLGGPIGVYETEAYPWLEAEIAVIRDRLHAQRPMIGACLGAQLIAAAAGARVYPGTREIGWAPITPTEAGRRSPLAALAEADWQVLHWHGDTFDLPAGAELLASTAATPHQAYAIGSHVLALQFHPEVKPGDIETWLIGHTVELGRAGIDPRTIRRRTGEIGAVVANAGERMFTRWMEEAGV